MESQDHIKLKKNKKNTDQYLPGGGELDRGKLKSKKSVVENVGLALQCDDSGHRKQQKYNGKTVSFNNKEIESDSDNDDINAESAPHNVDIGKMVPGSVGLQVMLDPSFSVLEGNVSAETLKAIEEMGFTKMTEIQAKAIPPLLEGRNLVGNAKTGSGKTLAFLIPAVEVIANLKFKPKHGTGCIIISPTRELAMQTFGVLQQVMKYHKSTYGVIMGGAHRITEAKKLESGINILVATPGRLLDHLENVKSFKIKNLMSLIIDEADRILEVGFEEEMKQIINILPKKRQSMLFSATSTKKTEDLVSLAIKVEPVYVGVDDKIEKATVDGLNQGYCICPSKQRFLLLYSFLKSIKDKKVMVFFSTCLSVKFHYKLLNAIDLPVMCIHGKQEQNRRTTTFFKFCDEKSGILLCTDVAARGLDIPAVDWIIQYDPPSDTKEYIHRVGRTARGEGSSGHALIFLRLEEIGFLYYLQKAKVPLNEFDFKWLKVSNIQSQLELIINKCAALNQAAQEGFKACAVAYDCHHHKDIFNIEKLNLTDLAKNFGLTSPPNVRLSTNKQNKKSRPMKRKGEGSLGDEIGHKSHKFV